MARSLFDDGRWRTVANAGVPSASGISRTPAAAPSVVNGCTGLRVPAAEPHQLALRLSILSADAPMRDEISLAARRFVRDDLSAAQTTAALLESYAVVHGVRRSA